ncbi:MAG: inositol monophosphatase, partial [Gammaproteobacteria bacterium]|nr:inositol monophosphatase [Gammaproteobacteria bacterium]
LRVSGRRQLIDSIFATGIPFAGRGPLPAALQDLARLMPLTAGVRRFGAASLDLAYVAAGRFDGFWEMGLNPWDIAAGALLVREAGGLVGNLRGEEGWLDSGNIVAANPKIFHEMLQVLQPSAHHYQ